MKEFVENAIEEIIDFLPIIIIVIAIIIIVGVGMLVYHFSSLFWGILASIGIGMIFIITYFVWTFRKYEELDSDVHIRP